MPARYDLQITRDADSKFSISLSGDASWIAQRPSITQARDLGVRLLGALGDPSAVYTVGVDGSLNQNTDYFDAIQFVHGRTYGASNLEQVAASLRTQVQSNQVVAYAQHLIVHFYLIPRHDQDAQDEIHHALTSGTLRGLPLHHTAYAITHAFGQGTTTAQEVIDSICNLQIEDQQGSIWRQGDVVYIHYVNHEQSMTLVGLRSSSNGSQLAAP